MFLYHVLYTIYHILYINYIPYSIHYIPHTTYHARILMLMWPVGPLILSLRPKRLFELQTLRESQIVDLLRPLLLGPAVCESRAAEDPKESVGSEASQHVSYCW